VVEQAELRYMEQDLSPKIKQELEKFGRCRYCYPPGILIVPACDWLKRFPDEMGIYDVCGHNIWFKKELLDAASVEDIRFNLVHLLVSSYDLLVYELFGGKFKEHHIEYYNIAGDVVGDDAKLQLDFINWLNEALDPRYLLSQYIAAKVMGKDDTVNSFNKWHVQIQSPNEISTEHANRINTGEDEPIEESIWHITSPVLQGWHSGTHLTMKTIRSLAKGITPKHLSDTIDGRGWLCGEFPCCIPYDNFTNDDVFALCNRVEEAIDAWATKK